MDQKHEYTPVPDGRKSESSTDEDIQDVPINIPARRRKFRLGHLLAAIVVSLVLVSAGVLIGMTIPAKARPTTSSSSRQPTKVLPAAEAWETIDGSRVEGTQCGNSWQEAEALGCHFDVMASRWYSPECFDAETLEGMLAEPQVNFTWYADREHTEVYPPEKALRGEFVKVWPDNAFHIKHCLYLWRRLHHAIIENKSIDEDLFSYGHTLHCTRMILEWMEPGFKRHTISFQTSGTPFCRRNPLGFLNSQELAK